jgi:hypothetical protein
MPTTDPREAAFVRWREAIKMPPRGAMNARVVFEAGWDAREAEADAQSWVAQVRAAAECEGCVRLEVERDRLAERVRRYEAVMAQAADYLASEKLYGPIFRAWEEGDIGQFEDRELSYAETVEAIDAGEDVVTDVFKVEAIPVYRALRAALADADAPPREGAGDGR